MFMPTKKPIYMIVWIEYKQKGKIILSIILPYMKSYYSFNPEKKLCLLTQYFISILFCSINAVKAIFD